MYSVAQLLNTVIPLLPTIIPIVIEALTWMSENQELVEIAYETVKTIKSKRSESIAEKAVGIAEK